MALEIKIPGPGDKRVLKNIAQGVFDKEVSEHLTAEFLDDPRHHLAVAIEAGVVMFTFPLNERLPPDIF